MKLKIFNTVSRKIEPFVSIKRGEVGFYCCGPTVYNYAHIGNLRTYVFEDIFRRVLEMDGYRVNHVMNITDVGHLTDDGDEGEDKMIKSARDKGMSVWDIADFFTDAFFKDTKRLNIKKPHTACRATKHIGNMIGLVKRLEDKGFAYKAGGNLYFDVSKFKEYGKMALLDRQELRAGSRIAVDQNKKNPQDFVLWFTESKFENQAMTWDSPWGKGYPGWHLECSAMSMKYLGDHFDIHCGGIDHISVHHTNEIAQSEAATGEKWVNYWVHGEFLVLNKGKMSKSKGNFLTLDRLIEEGFDPMDYRYFCLNGHYRSQLQFSFESLQSSADSRASLIKKVQSILKICQGKVASDITDSELIAIFKQFEKDCYDDLNMPRALSRLYAVIKKRDNPSQQLALIYKMDEIFGLGLDQIKFEISEELLDKELQLLIDQREQARLHKNYSESDRIRDLLLEKGISVKDGPDGTVWERI